ncbi:MAG TPA: type II secretion system protein GspL [Rubrivivax sp.]|nr:type II secretion system protein GspL [Rubrivivax sp.]
MPVLVILVPARARLSARGPDGAAGKGEGEGDDTFAYVLSPDGLQVGSQGRARPELLPRADSVVAVLADADVGWQRVTVPRAPASRLRAALGGMLEERLLDDDEALHLALAPGAAAGAEAWVAVVHRSWLRATIERIERGGRIVDRVLPPAWPGDAPQGHFQAATAAPAGTADLMLSCADAQGLALLRLQGSLARVWLARMQAQPTRWTATPEVAAPAERWLGSGVTVLTDAERALQAARSLWNLRQFELAPRHRGARALRDAWHRLRSPAWRPARIGLAALLVLQLAGLNAWAWQQRQAVAARQQQQAALLRSTFPAVRAVLDAPLQMRRETEALRAAAGRAGAEDLEALLGAAAAAWPDGQEPLQALRFEPGRLSLRAPGWTDAQTQQFRERLRAAGYAVDSAEGGLTLSRAERPA